MFGNKFKEVTIAYKRVFESSDGKIVLKDLMKCCNFTQSVIGRDPHETYFNEGSRAILLRILKTLALSEDDINKYIQEIEKGDLDE
jgi:hypothetical protein